MNPAFRRRLARFNRRVTNHITGPFATQLPGFAVVRHTGRRSGRTYRTPVNAFRSADGYVIALTYGAEAQWVRNVLAAGGCELETRGRRIALTAPELFHDEARRAVPPPVRAALRLLGVADFMRLRR
jgi:deazaflavin-dependent oxidoreductase (nitroreductase family)